MTDAADVAPAGEGDTSTEPAGPTAEQRERAAELVLMHTPILSNVAQIGGTISAIAALADYLSEGTVPTDVQPRSEP